MSILILNHPILGLAISITTLLVGYIMMERSYRWLDVGYMLSILGVFATAIFLLIIVAG